MAVHGGSGPFISGSGGLLHLGGPLYELHESVDEVLQFGGHQREGQEEEFEVIAN